MNHSPMNRPAVDYFSHIDGLRALAVMAVVLFHFDLAGFSGGYVGVDVFFVISGFLITRLILRELERNGRFSFSNFYLRRIRRLFPALFATLLLSLLVAVVMLSPDRLFRFSASMLSAIFSVSNIFFWSESGYFDTDAITKPLLHTWSLGVEEQFYLIWPAMTVGIFVLTRRVFTTIALVGLVSLAANYYGMLMDAGEGYGSTVFFWMPFRIFEFALGALCIPFFGKAGRPTIGHDLMIALGLALIGYSVVAFSHELVFPLHYALVPCLGSMLIILSTRPRFLGSLLRARPVVFVGLISYSLYLVHWPVVVFYRYYVFRPLTLAETGALFVVMMVIAALMYRWVETPFRKPRGKTQTTTIQGHRGFVTAMAASAFALSAVGVVSIQTGGMAFRMPEALTAAEFEQGMQRRFNAIKSGCTATRLDEPEYCKLDRPIQVLVFGDSHAPDGLNILTGYYRDDPRVNLIYLGSINGCELEFRDGQPFSATDERDCARRFSIFENERLLASIDAVLLSSNRPFTTVKRRAWGVLAYLHETHPAMRIIVRGSYLNTAHDCVELHSRFNTFDACTDERFVNWAPADEGNSPRAALADGVAFDYIDVFGMMCSDRSPGSCTSRVGDVPAFYDKHHFSLEFAERVGSRLRAGGWNGLDSDRLAETGG